MNGKPLDFTDLDIMTIEDLLTEEPRAGKKLKIDLDKTKKENLP